MDEDRLRSPVSCWKYYCMWPGHGLDEVTLSWPHTVYGNGCAACLFLVYCSHHWLHCLQITMWLAFAHFWISC